MCPYFCFYEVPQKTRYAFCTASINTLTVHSLAFSKEIYDLKASTSPSLPMVRRVSTSGAKA